MHNVHGDRALTSRSRDPRYGLRIRFKPLRYGNAPRRLQDSGGHIAWDGADGRANSQRVGDMRDNGAAVHDECGCTPRRRSALCDLCPRSGRLALGRVTGGGSRAKERTRDGTSGG